MKIDYEENVLVIEDTDKIKSTKIFTSRFPALIGANKFKKQGDELLSMFGLLPKEPFDEFYTLRGKYAEEIVKIFFDRLGVSYKHYGMDSSGNKEYDVFSNKVFGGVPDFIVNGTQNVEVKATNLSKRKFIEKTHGKQEHIAQVEISSYLGSCNQAFLIYVFFSDNDEEKIRNELKTKVKTFNPESFDKKKISKFNVYLNEDKIKTKMLIAYDLVEKTKASRKIPLELIRESTLNKLGFKQKVDIFEQKRLV